MGIENYRGDAWRSHPLVDPKKSVRRPFLGAMTFSLGVFGVAVLVEYLYKTMTPDYEENRALRVQKAVDESIQQAQSAFNVLGTHPRTSPNGKKSVPL